MKKCGKCFTSEMQDVIMSNGYCRECESERVWSKKNHKRIAQEQLRNRKSYINQMRRRRADSR